MDWNEDSIEEFIRSNRNKFDSYVPKDVHSTNFLKKLQLRFRVIISIIPHLVKVAIVTIFVFVISYFVWKNYLSNQDEISLGQVSLQYKELEVMYKARVFMLSNEVRKKADKKVVQELNMSDTTYTKLKKELKADPDNQRIVDAMVQYYEMKIKTLESISKQTPL